MYLVIHLISIKFVVVVVVVVLCLNQDSSSTQRTRGLFHWRVSACFANKSSTMILPSLNRSI